MKIGLPAVRRGFDTVFSSLISLFVFCSCKYFVHEDVEKGHLCDAERVRERSIYDERERRCRFKVSFPLFC